MVDDNLSPLQLEYQQAANALRDSLNALPSEQSPQPLDLKEVLIGKGTEEKRRRTLEDAENGNTPSTLVLTLKGDSVERDHEQVAAVVNNFLRANVPSIADNVEFDPPAVHAEKMMKQLQKFQQAGADIPYDVSKFRMFDKAVMEEGNWIIDDHAFGIAGVDYFSSDNLFPDKTFGIKIQLSVPTKPGEEDPAGQQVLNNLRTHEEEIKAKLAERLVKYTPDLDDAGKAALKAKVMAMKIAFPPKDTKVSGFFEIVFRSDEQTKAFDAYKPATPLDEKTKDDLESSNPLNKLNKEQLGKALGRSLLHYGPDAKEIFPIIAGREDVAQTVGKALKKFELSIKDSNPELAKEVEAFIKADDLKNHRAWDKPKSERPKLHKPVLVTKSPNKFGEMEISFQLSAKDASAAITQFAALGSKQQTTTPAADAPAATAQTPPAEDGRLAVNAATTELGAATKVPTIDPASIAAAEAAKRDKPPETGAAR